jgi:hypothetical protein
MTLQDDNLIFDRLADGELSSVERQELLSTLDSRPDGWRRCALAFLEAQAWRGEFRSLLTPGSSPTLAPGSNFRTLRAAMPTSPLARPPREMRWIESSFAVAASALLAFGIGWKMNSPRAIIPAQQDIASNSPPIQQPFADSRDALTLVVQDTQGKPQRVRVPLIDAAALGDQWAEDSANVPIDVRTELRDRGFDLKNKRRFAPLFFEQDKQLVPMVVPVNDTYVVPVNRPVY